MVLSGVLLMVLARMHLTILARVHLVVLTGMDHPILAAHPLLIFPSVRPDSFWPTLRRAPTGISGRCLHFVLVGSCLILLLYIRCFKYAG